MSVGLHHCDRTRRRTPSLLLLTRVETTSFTTGLVFWMTLIQVFLRFDQPLAEDWMPPEPLRPYQRTSYAIQARPWPV